MLRDVGISGRRIVVYYLYGYLDVPEDLLKCIRGLITWGVVVSDPFEVARVLKEGVNIKE